MTRELQSTLEASGIEWPASRNHLPCMAQVIQLAFDAFMSSIGVKGRTKSWEAHERVQQFGETASTDIGKSQRLRREDNARINKVSAMRPGLAKIIEKVRISQYFESPELTIIQQTTLAVLITLSPGRRNEFIDCRKAKVRIIVLPIIDVKTRWNSILELLECANRLRELTCYRQQNLEYIAYRPLFTTHDEWTILKYAMEGLSPSRYWTLRISKRCKVIFHHVVTVYSDMFDQMDGVIRDLSKKTTHWKGDLFFAVRVSSTEAVQIVC